MQSCSDILKRCCWDQKTHSQSIDVSPLKWATYCRGARGREVVMPKLFLFQSLFHRIAEWFFPGVLGGNSQCHVVLLERQDTPNTLLRECSITNETSRVLGTNQTTHTGLFENRVPSKYTRLIIIFPRRVFFWFESGLSHLTRVSCTAHQPPSGKNPFDGSTSVSNAWQSTHLFTKNSVRVRFVGVRIVLQFAGHLNLLLWNSPKKSMSQIRDLLRGFSASASPAEEIVHSTSMMFLLLCF